MRHSSYAHQAEVGRKQKGLSCRDGRSTQSTCCATPGRRRDRVNLSLAALRRQQHGSVSCCEQIRADSPVSSCETLYVVPTRSAVFSVPLQAKEFAYLCSNKRGLYGDPDLRTRSLNADQCR